MIITKILKSIISLIKFVITLVIIAIVAIILVQRFSNNKMTVAGYRMFTVVTESMVPKYLVGDVLLVKEKDVSQIEVGEDVTYLGKIGSYADKIVTHQVIKIEKKEDGTLDFHTKGIANPSEDPIVNESQIYGVVLAKMQLITKLNGIINNMYGMYFLIIIPLAIIIFSEFKSFKEDKKSYDEDDDDDDDDEDEDEKDDDYDDYDEEEEKSDEDDEDQEDDKNEINKNHTQNEVDDEEYEDDYEYDDEDEDEYEDDE